MCTRTLKNLQSVATNYIHPWECRPILCRKIPSPFPCKPRADTGCLHHSHRDRSTPRALYKTGTCGIAWPASFGLVYSTRRRPISVRMGAGNQCRREAYIEEAMGTFCGKGSDGIPKDVKGYALRVLSVRVCFRGQRRPRNRICSPEWGSGRQG